MEKGTLKINELRRSVLPELAASLEKYGQLQPILIDKLGRIHDGWKRVYLCGLEQLPLKTIVENEAPCSNVRGTKEQRKAMILAFYNDAQKGYGDRAIEHLSERYGVSRATIFRWVHDMKSLNETIEQPAGKPKINCPKCGQKKWKHPPDWICGNCGERIG